MGVNDDGSPQTTLTRIEFEPRNVWRTGLVLLGVVAFGLLLQFVISDGGAVLFTVLMAWFASIAMEPAVGLLSRRMRRGAATAVVMLVAILAIAGFFWAFGSLFVSQVAQLIGAIPTLVDNALAWVNERFETDYAVEDIFTSINLSPAQIADYSTQVLGGVLAILGTLLGSFFSLFTFGLFTFYLSADAPRLRRYVASLFRPNVQAMVMQVWDVTASKTGAYVAARVILATINGVSSALVFLAIGMPSWLALGIWTGIVAQFVPTIGTYIAIALPVIVGLLSGNPIVGLLALIWAIIYQQVENLTFEPRISARAVDVHPAFGFASVMLGAALFGVAGALLAIPVGAMLIALLEANRTRYDVVVSTAVPQNPPSTLS